MNNVSNCICLSLGLLEVEVLVVDGISVSTASIPPIGERHLNKVIFEDKPAALCLILLVTILLLSTSKQIHMVIVYAFGHGIEWQVNCI